MRPEPPARVILTVTPNPSLDLLFEADRLVWDDANRMPDPRRRPGGQGINVARAVRALGGRAVAVALLAGETGAGIARLLEAECVPLEAVRGNGDTRTFVAVRERETGRSLLLNARGPARTAEDADALADRVEQVLARLQPAWLACCGSLPPGFPPDFYRRLALIARGHGVRVVVDCDGEPLALAAPHCDLLVPNQHEAERLLSGEARDVGSAGAMARRLIASGAALACVTLGAEGAVLASERGCWHAAPPPLRTGSAVGAGDAFLGALLLEAGGEPEEALRRAVAAGSATLLSRGAGLVDAGDARSLLDGVEVSPVGKG